MQYLVLVLLFFLFGCSEGVIKLGGKDTAEGSCLEMNDESMDCDSDGYAPEDGDCDDASSLVHPGALEDCADTIDNNCDGATDGSDGTCAGSADDDLDGYTIDDGDCDDTDATVNPGVPEVCNDGIDNDCDAATGDSGADLDNDGYSECSGDCDDLDSTVNPSSSEVWYDGVDQNCDGNDADQDGDGYNAGDDCLDTDVSINPGADEVCDGVDNNCDGSTDLGATDESEWYADVDGDGYGDAAATDSACDAPTGYVGNAEDCDDTNAAINPSVSEVCGNATDDDCDASTADATGSAWYVDTDGDGYGSGSSTTSCTSPGSEYVTVDGDCDETSYDVNPGATEVCDSVDNNCDGSTDGADAADQTDWYEDVDGDGYGDVSVTIAACDQPVGYVSTSGDCDTANATAFPGGTETCDSLDNDCDGTIDDGVQSKFYADADGDSWGSATTYVEDCTAPSGYVEDNSDCNDADAEMNQDDADSDGETTCDGDCDDGDSAANTGETESCDEIDNDCDGTVDEGVTTRFYEDADGDLWGSSTVFRDECSAPVGYVTDNSDCDDSSVLLNNDDTDRDGYSTCDGDCDDTDITLDLDDMDGDGYTSCDGDCNESERTFHPGATETCDDRDEDCDGVADNGLSTSTYYLDSDSDGYGNAASPVTDCAAPSGTVSNDDDCNDSSYAVYPGATETCNGSDDDCDGTNDEDFDVDGDGTLSEATCPAYGDDCDDSEATTYVGAVESCDGVDNDCDDAVDEDFDNDGDGFADEAACAEGTDCNDSDDTVYPRDHELDIGEDANCTDGIDNNCDGDTDAASADCGDGDSDGIYNGVDALYPLDDDGDGLVETLCVVASLTMDEPYASGDAIRQGTPTGTWGGFSTVNTAHTDTLGAYESGAWCYDFTGMTTTRYRYRYVSASTTGACATWEISDIADFCDEYRDEYCVQYGTGTAPCGYNWVVSVEYQSSGEIRGGN